MNWWQIAGTVYLIGCAVTAVSLIIWMCFSKSYKEDLMGLGEDDGGFAGIVLLWPFLVLSLFIDAIELIGVVAQEVARINKRKRSTKAKR